MTKTLLIGFGSAEKKLALGKLSFTVYRSLEGARLISVRSVSKAMGYDGKSKKWPFEFLQHLNKLTPVDPALLEALSYDIVVAEKGKTVPVITASDFIKFIRIVVQANRDGFLYMSEQKFAKAAETLSRSLEQQDLAASIDFVTGFDRFKQNHRELLMNRMRNATGLSYPVWVKSLPDEFLEIILAFRNGQWTDLNEKWADYANLLNDLIFSRLDEATFTALEISQPKKVYSKGLSIERYRMHPALQKHILEMVELLRSASLDPAIFRQLLEKRFPPKRELAISAADGQRPKEIGSLTENLRIAVGGQ